MLNPRSRSNPLRDFAQQRTSTADLIFAQATGTPQNATGMSPSHPAYSMGAPAPQQPATTMTAGHPAYGMPQPQPQTPAPAITPPLTAMETSPQVGEVPIAPAPVMKSPQQMIIEGAKMRGLDPLDVATAISYETAGTFNPTKAGPTTQWGQHRGYIQFGEQQAGENGVNWDDPINSQLDPENGAVWKYLENAGVKEGMGLLDIYSAINAGGVGLYNRTDENNGGAPGSVQDKVNGMGDHRAKAARFLGGQFSYTPEQRSREDSAPASSLSYGTDVGEIGDPVLQGFEPQQQDYSTEKAPPPIPFLDAIMGQPVNQRQAPTLGTPAGQDSSMTIAALLAPEAIDEALPADPETGTPASTVVDAAVAEIADVAFTGASTDYDASDPPRTLQAVVEAVESSPAEGDDPEEIKRKQERRMMAADMLAVLSQGLGQMGAGQAVDLSQILTAQSERRQQQMLMQREADEKQRQEAQAAQQRQALASQLQQQGRPELAQLALNPATFDQAASAAETLLTRETSPTDGMGYGAKVELLQGLGLSRNDAAAVADDPAWFRQYVSNARGLDADSNSLRAETDEFINQLPPEAFSDPALRPMIASQMRSPSRDGLGALRNAVQGAGLEPAKNVDPEKLIADAGIDPNSAQADLIRQGDAETVNRTVEGLGNVTEASNTTAATTAAEMATSDAMQQASNAALASRMVNAGIYSPQEGELVRAMGPEAAAVEIERTRGETQKLQEDAQVQAVARDISTGLYAKTGDPTIRRLFSNVRTSEQLETVLDVVNSNDAYDIPAEAKTALLMAASPELRSEIIARDAAQAGNSLGTMLDEGILGSMLETQKTRQAGHNEREPMVTAMEGLLDLITNPEYAEEAGGPLAPLRMLSQDAVNDIFGENSGFSEALASDNEMAVYNMIEAVAAQYYSTFRTEGVGSMSDFESKQFIKVLPNISTPALRQAMLAQRVVRAETNARTITEARNQFMIENRGKPETLLSSAAISDYVNNAVKEGAVRDFPLLDVTADTFEQDINLGYASGDITDNTVIEFVDEAGKTNFIFARDMYKE